MIKPSIDYIRKVLWVFSVVYFSLHISGQVTFGMFSDVLTTQWRLSLWQKSLLILPYYLGYMLFQIPAGLMMDRWGIKKLMPIAMFTALLASYFFQISNDYVMGFVSRFIMGVGFSFSFIGMANITYITFHSNKVTRFFSYAELFAAFATLVAEKINAHMLVSYSWQFIYFRLSMIIMLCFFCVLICSQYIPENQAQEKQISFFISLKQVCQKIFIWRYSFNVGVLYTQVYIWVAFWLYPWLEHVQGLNIEICTDMIGSAMIGTIVAFLYIGPVASWILFCNKFGVVT